MVSTTLNSARWLPYLRHWPATFLFVLAGCSSLPTIVPELARRPGPPVQLESAGGPLSVAHSKAILDRLEGSGQNNGLFERHL
ncbi:MAG: hypothetical protein WA146_09900, partial [Thiobacillus sp.]